VEFKTAFFQEEHSWAQSGKIIARVFSRFKIASPAKWENCSKRSIDATGATTGRECTNAVFIPVLFCALCHIQSLFAIYRNLQRCPDDRTVTVAIMKTLPTYTALQQRINDVLAEGLPKNLLRGKQRLAIDLVLIPYHGQPAYHENEIDRSQPKNATLRR